MPTTRSVRAVRARVLAWYARQHRAFPWRGLLDPYPILVSEVMLQQTQAARVAERFPAFVERFPTAAALAAADSAAVLVAWSGLGYNRRALALQRAAAWVAAAGWPRDAAGLAALPGVGPYTARAVASLAFGAPEGVVDTNVRRWLLRRFAVTDQPRALQALADALARPGPGPPPGPEAVAWTHASMEFGASICSARGPRCTTCPIARGCPSRGRAGAVAVPRQTPFSGSRRAYRGAVLRELSMAPGHRLPGSTLLGAVGASNGHGLDDPGWEELIAALERDRLLHRSGADIVLGTAPASGATASGSGPTIGP